jgi:hypothetical protein
MTAQTSARMQRMPDRGTTRPANILKTIGGITTIRPMDKSDIPVSRGRNRASMRDLEVVKEFNALLDHINKQNLNPSEIAGEIMLDTPEIAAERGKRKSFAQSFRKLLRTSIKEHGLLGYVDVMEFNHGERLFVVGRSAA